jgi:hypothetical protein
MRQMVRGGIVMDLVFALLVPVIARADPVGVVMMRPRREKHAARVNRGTHKSCIDQAVSSSDLV